MILSEHAEIHDSEAFSVDMDITAVATSGVLRTAGTPVYIGINTGAKRVHIRPAGLNAIGDVVEFELLKGSVFTGGTPMLVNSHEDSVADDSADVTFVTSPTVTTVGTHKARVIVAGSQTSVGANTSATGAKGEVVNEYILNANSQYLIRLRNRSYNNVDAYAWGSLFFYENH